MDSLNRDYGLGQVVCHCGSSCGLSRYASRADKRLELGSSHSRRRDRDDLSLEDSDIRNDALEGNGRDGELHSSCDKRAVRRGRRFATEPAGGTVMVDIGILV